MHFLILWLYLFCCMQKFGGVYKLRNVDKLHMKYLKSFLGIKHQTPNYAVLGEFGRLPISVICKQRSLKFLCRMMNRNNTLLYETYNKLCNRMYQNSWSSRINDIIDCLGFTNIRIAYGLQYAKREFRTFA